MRKLNLLVIVIILSVLSSLSFCGEESMDWEQLKNHKVPEWFKDAKFGIYAHWGAYCVPAFGSEWYPRNMYLKESDVHEHHVKTWGDPSKFGYKDFIPMFKAEKFDADEWAELYIRAGAKFAGPVAEHHDGFSMWASKVNRWNSVDMGPKRDVVKEITEALRKRGIKIITSFHHMYNFQGYYSKDIDPALGWDITNPEYEDLYGQFKDEKIAHDRWLEKIKEVIDAYQPDQVWFDFGLEDIPDEYKRRMASYYYSKEKDWGKEVIITRKEDHLPEGVGVLDIERGKMEGAAPYLWQTDDSISVKSWSWVVGDNFKSPEEMIHELIDIVSKNGILLLNVCPKTDGTFTEDQKELLYTIGDWLQVNGEAIYGTRPWAVHGEGPNLLDEGRGFGDDQIDFTSEDIRYTRKGDVLYAIALGWPEGEMTLKTPMVKEAGDKAKITLLGYEGEIEYSINEKKQLVIEVPELDEDERPWGYAYSFKISGFELERSKDPADIES
ncbi:MAG: alpha-L-fucosidase [Planctomycetota bacterium]|jgi:alpha-L-fucosidase